MAVALCAVAVVWLACPVAQAEGRSNFALQRGVQRTSHDESSDSATAGAVRLLKRYGLVPHVVPPFRLVLPTDFPDLSIVASLRAFRVERGGIVDPVIYIVETDPVYQLARRGAERGIALLASTILHEVVHGARGDEYAAIEAEIAFLREYVVTERRNTRPLMWQIFELERRLKAPQLAAADAVKAPIVVEPK